MKLTLAQLKSMQVTPMSGAVLVEGCTNLYTHPGLKGVLLRRLKKPESAWGCNGVVFSVVTGGSAGIGNLTVGATIGYVGHAWRELLDQVTEFGMTIKPKGPGHGTEAKVLAPEINGVTVYTNPSLLRRFHNAWVEKNEYVWSNLLVTSGTVSFIGDWTSGIGNVTVMEVVTGADDGIFGFTSDLAAANDSNDGTSSYADVRGYLSTEVRLPPLRALIDRNYIEMRALFPKESWIDVDEVYPGFVAAWVDRDKQPTLCFWTNVSDGVFGVPHFHPTPSGGSPNLYSDVSGTSTAHTAAPDGSRAYFHNPFPGYLGVRTGATERARIIGNGYLAPRFKALSGMVDVIDVNAIRRGQSPHLLSVVEDKTTINQLADTVEPNPYTMPQAGYNIGGDLALRTTDVALTSLGSTMQSSGYWRVWTMNQHLQASRRNLGTLGPMLDRFIDAFTDAVVDHARARLN